jgi:hypothetical protein
VHLLPEKKHTVFGGHGHSLPVAFFFPSAIMGKPETVLWLDFSHPQLEKFNHKGHEGTQSRKCIERKI